jgi:hypothetical protein
MSAISGVSKSSRVKVNDMIVEKSMNKNSDFFQLPPVRGLCGHVYTKRSASCIKCRMLAMTNQLKEKKEEEEKNF